MLADANGIFAWGWNHSGPTGLGVHAEAHCLSRANKARLPDAVMYVAGQRSRNGRSVPSKPCAACAKAISKVGTVIWRDANGVWHESV